MTKENLPDSSASDICKICGLWGSLPDSSCDFCPNSYHDRCLPKIHRQKQYRQCADLGQRCDHKNPPIHFRFGPLKEGDSDNDNEPAKSPKLNSKDLQRNSSGTGANQYESFVFNGTEYNVGDDIVITMPKEEGLWGVARITKIYHDPLADDIPLLRLLWFWRATELSSTTPDNIDEFERGSQTDREYHELHLDERCPGDIYVDELIDSKFSSKALVVSTEKEYVDRVADGSYKLDYHDIYWCTHTFNHQSGKLVKISAARLRAIVHSPNSKKHKKKKAPAPPRSDELQVHRQSAQTVACTVSPIIYQEITNLKVSKDQDSNEDDDDVSMKPPQTDNGTELRVDTESTQSSGSRSASLINFAASPITKSSRRSSASLHSEGGPLSVSISPSPAPSPDTFTVLGNQPVLLLNPEMFNERKSKSLEIEVMITGSHESEDSSAKLQQEIGDLKRQLDLERTRREFWHKKYDEGVGHKKQVLHLQYALDQERKQRIAMENKAEFVRSMSESVAPGQEGGSDLERYKEIAFKLYTECIHGQGPRWHSVKTVTQQRIRRDQELADLRTAITSHYPKGSLTVIGIGKWEGNRPIEQAVESYIIQNGEYSTHSMTYLNLDDDIQEEVYLESILEKVIIKDHPRIPVLNGQNGVRVKRDIPKNTCLGQYIGGEILQDAFDKIFDGSGREYDHNLYSFDQEIDAKELQRVNVIPKDKKKKSRKRGRKKGKLSKDEVPQKIFIIDPFIGEWGEDELMLRYVNDCRADINTPTPTTDDNQYYNVEFAGLSVNGWPQTFLMTKRDIKRGEELLTYYGDEFASALTMKADADKQKQLKKERIDQQILGGVSL